MMNTDNASLDSASKKKAFFIRLEEDVYHQVVELAKKEERGISKTANRLIRKQLTDSTQ